MVRVLERVAVRVLARRKQRLALRAPHHRDRIVFDNLRFDGFAHRLSLKYRLAY